MPVPADASTPEDSAGKIAKNLLWLIPVLSVIDVTLTLPRTLAMPSRIAFVVPSSTSIATARPALPSPPLTERAILVNWSILSACTYRSPPTVNWEAPETLAIVFDSMMETATAALTPFAPSTSA